MKGRKPKPTKLHVIHGNPSKKQINYDEPEPEPVENPSAPKHLDKIGASLWRSLSRELSILGILGRIDLKALERYCECYSGSRQAQEDRKKHGVTVWDGDKPITAPWVRTYIALSAEMRQIESSIGMGGAANRAKVKVDEKPKKTAADKFRARKRN